MVWTIERVGGEFGEDVLRDIVRDVNDLMCGKAGRGIKANRIGLADEIWKKLLRRGGYKDEGIAKAIAGEELMQADAVAAFNPYTIHTVVNIVDDNGGPITRADLDALLSAALSYRQLIKPGQT
jgi:hypothetical protein